MLLSYILIFHQVWISQASNLRDMPVTIVPVTIVPDRVAIFVVHKGIKVDL